MAEPLKNYFGPEVPARPKVFTLKELELEPRGFARLAKTISLAQHTTRTHYPGLHRVEVLVNGRRSGARAFHVVGIPGS
jgi:hypothetical protein